MKKWYLLLLILVLIPSISAANYTGNFIIDKNRVQLGDEFIISGEILKNNRPLEEQINILVYFNGPEEKREVYTSIIDGEFQLKNRFRNTPPGTYQIDVILKDLNGETLEEFKDINSIFIENGIELSSNLKKNEINPGDILKIEGSIIRKLDSAPLKKATIRIHIDDLILTTDAINGRFEYSFSTSPTIKSGQHEVFVEARDEFGNVGSDTEKVSVIPTPTSMEISLSKKIFLPAESVQIIPYLLDQAKENIITDAQIKIYNPKNKRVFSLDTATSKLNEFKLDNYALPGQWKIKVSSKKIDSEAVFEVELVGSIQASLEKNILKIENTGNIKYEKVLELIITSGEEKSIIKRRTNINPGDSFEIDMKKELVKEGSYYIKILNTDQEFSLELDEGRNFAQQVTDMLTSITGQAVGKSGTAPSNTPTYTFLLLILILILITAYRFKIAKKRTKLPIPQNKKKKFGFIKKITKRNKEKREIRDLKSKLLQNEPQKPKTENKMPEHLIPPKESLDEKRPRKIEFDEPFKFR